MPAVRPSFLVFVARDGTCLPAHHGLLSSQRHWPHARVGIGIALVGGGLRHHHRRRRVKRLSVQSCKCARKASGCSRGAPSRSRCAVCTRSRVTVQTKARVVSWSGRCQGSTLRLPLPRPALRRGPALALLLRVHAHAPVAVYSVRGSLELCARRRAPPTASSRWPSGRALAHSRDDTATRAICGVRRRCVRTGGGFRRVSSVAEARLESGERPVANRREQQALANCRAVHFFVSKPELGI